GGRLSLEGLQHVLESSGAAESEDRRQVEGKHDGSRYAGQFRPQSRDDGAGALSGIGSLLVWLQADDEESLVRRGDTVDEVEPHHRKYALDAGDGSDDVLHPLHYCTRAVDRGALRQAHRGEESSLVFLRQEALRGHAEKPGRAHK